MAGRSGSTVHRVDGGSAGQRVTPFDQVAWASLRASSDRREFAASWLALQCRTLGAVTRAVVVLEEAEGAGYGPVASWPDDVSGVDQLGDVAELAMTEGRGVVQAVAVSPEGGAPANDPGAEASHQIAYPVQMDEAVRGVVALEVRGRDDRGLRQTMRQLQWGVGWLEVLLRRETAAEAAARQERVAAALDLLAAALDHERYAAAATAVATDLATRLDCERVSVGLLRRGHCRLAGLSHSAEVSRRMNLVRAIETAMDECVDQGTPLHFVAGQGAHDDPWVTRAHAELSRRHGALALVTVPLTSGERTVGAITLEHSDPAAFDARRLELIEAVGAVVGPILSDKRGNDRLLVVKVFDSLRTQLARLLGPGYLGRKLAGLTLAGLVGFFAWYHTDYRVTADARLEGAVQRSVAAPYDGYLREVAARPGDLVQAGDVIARLDDRDLRLERLGRIAERRQFELERDAALAEGERAQVAILDARIRQTEAQLALLDERLARAAVRAPFDGVVVSGDLTQRIGAALSVGEELVQVAPTHDYRVVLRVDERDINELRPGQTGSLRVAARPDARLAFEVAQITPVSQPRDGRNTFRVEAKPDLAAASAAGLLPGMEGVGKVAVGERRLIWIWTHRAIEWLRVTAWRWWP